MARRHNDCRKLSSAMVGVRARHPQSAPQLSHGELSEIAFKSRGLAESGTVIAAGAPISRSSELSPLLDGSAVLAWSILAIRRIALVRSGFTFCGVLPDKVFFESCCSCFGGLLGALHWSALGAVLEGSVLLVCPLGVCEALRVPLVVLYGFASWQA